MLSSAWAPGLLRSHLSPAGRNGLSRLPHQRGTGGTAPAWEKPAPEECSGTATTPGTSSPAKEPDISQLGKGAKQEHTRKLSMKMAE